MDQMVPDQPHLMVCRVSGRWTRCAMTKWSLHIVLMHTAMQSCCAPVKVPCSTLIGIVGHVGRPAGLQHLSVAKAGQLASGTLWCCNTDAPVQGSIGRPDRPGKHHPAAWDTHCHGPAFGNCNRPSTSPAKAERRTALHAGNAVLFPPHSPTQRAHSPRPYEQRQHEQVEDIAKLEDVRLLASHLREIV